MGIYFIADMHFGDERILRYENRPFADACQMTEEMVSLWNETIGSDDEVYVVGDVGDDAVVKHLNGIKYLIKGNHDVKSNEEYRRCGFTEVYDHPIILDGFWILSHEPLYVNENMPYANIFGHVHNSPLYRTFSRQHYCVSVERTGYRPVSFDKIKAQVSRA